MFKMHLLELDGIKLFFKTVSLYLVNKTNRCTELQFYLYYDSTCFGQPFCPSSGVLSRTLALVHFMQLWWLHKMYQSQCMAQNSWWWAERLPETCRVVIPIKLEFGASVGFNHNESITMHSHTIIKFNELYFYKEEAKAHPGLQSRWWWYFYKKFLGLKAVS